MHTCVDRLTVAQCDRLARILERRRAQAILVERSAWIASMFEERFRSLYETYKLEDETFTVDNVTYKVVVRNDDEVIVARTFYRGCTATTSYYVIGTDGDHCCPIDKRILDFVHHVRKKQKTRTL